MEEGREARFAWGVRRLGGDGRQNAATERCGYSGETAFRLGQATLQGGQAPYGSFAKRSQL